MSDTFAQIDPKPLPQVSPGGASPKAARASGNAADAPSDEFESLLSQNAARKSGDDPAKDSTGKAGGTAGAGGTASAGGIAGADGSDDAGGADADQNPDITTDAAIAPVPASETNALALATALAGVVPGQPVPVNTNADGRSGLKVDAPTLPPTPGGGPLANANPENAASSGENAQNESTAKPTPAGAPGAAQPTPRTADGSAQTASRTSATSTSTAAAAPGGQATGGAQSAVASPATPGNPNLPSGGVQTQAAAGQTATATADAKQSRSSTQRVAEIRKEAGTAPARSQTPQQGGGLTTAQAALAIERVLGEASATGNPGPATGGANGLNQGADTVLRVASPLTPGAPPNLPVRSIALSIMQQSAQGVRQFTINLVPASLGRIKIDLEIGKDGKVNANLTVDRPDTLDALQRDARALERALQNAGLKTDQGSLSFSLRDQPGGQQTAERDASGQDQQGLDVQPLPEHIPQRSMSLSALDISV